MVGWVQEVLMAIDCRGACVQAKSIEYSRAATKTRERRAESEG